MYEDVNNENDVDDDVNVDENMMMLMMMGSIRVDLSYLLVKWTNLFSI